MSQDVLKSEINKIAAKIDADAKKSSTWGSLSGITGLGTAAALLGPLGLAAGGIGAIAAGVLLSRKLKKEKAAKKIREAASAMNNEQMNHFYSSLQQMSSDEITTESVESILSHFESTT